MKSVWGEWESHFLAPTPERHKGAWGEQGVQAQGLLCLPRRLLFFGEERCQVCYKAWRIGLYFIQGTAVVPGHGCCKAFCLFSLQEQPPGLEKGWRPFKERGGHAGGDGDEWDIC